MRETVAESAIFRAFPFAPGAREFLLSAGQERHLWMAYCLARTYERMTVEFMASSNRRRSEVARVALQG